MSGGPRGAEEERGQRRRAGAGGQVFWIQCTHWYVLPPVGPGEPWKHVKQGSHMVTFVTMICVCKAGNERAGDKTGIRRISLGALCRVPEALLRV